MKTAFNLRPWLETDLPALVNYANNPKIASRLTDQFPHPYTEEAGKKFIAMAQQAPLIRAIEINGEATGGIGVHPQQDVYRLNAELGYWLAEPFWGKGIITEAIVQICEMAFRELEITRIYARPYGSNAASQRVLEKAGFTLEAKISQSFIKNGMLEDELIYALRRQ